MDRLLRVKKKFEEYSLGNIAKRKRFINSKIIALIERERQYQISSDRLLRASRDARSVYSGIGGFELRERRSWSERAMFLRQFSQEKIKNIKIDLVHLRDEEAKELTNLNHAKNKLNIIESSIFRILKYRNVKNEVGEFDELDIPMRMGGPCE